MTSEALLLVGRRTHHAKQPFEVHAERLRARGAVDEVRVGTYETEPVRELRSQVETIAADRVYAVPMYAARTYDTDRELPAALSYVPGTVHCCEPLGQSPAVTDALLDRATGLVPAGPDASLVLVSFGSSSKPYHRQTSEYHADRIRSASGYGEVVTSYLVQNPAVECARYNVSNRRVVAVPLFFTRSTATEERIPAALELERGGLEYADPLGDHGRVTDAIHAAVERKRTLATTADEGAVPSPGPGPSAQDHPPVVTDGEGEPR
ncbi:MAG: CbiX/SirB N-terminal domain-containing protein [Salinirussus sp.]